VSCSIHVSDDGTHFYFDLALSSSPTALPALLAFAVPSRITYGSEFPCAPAPAYQSMTQMLDAYPLTDDQRHAIDSGNAQHLAGPPACWLPWRHAVTSSAPPAGPVR
jgi:hypothetical protein